MLQKRPSLPSSFTFSTVCSSNGWKPCFQSLERLLPLGGKVASTWWKQAAITQMDTLLQGPFVSVIADSTSAEPFFLENELSVQFATFR